MKLSIKDGVVSGILMLHSGSYIVFYVIAYLAKYLYNLTCYAWYDPEFDKVCIKLYGSIISMMQVKKCIEMMFSNSLYDSE